MDKIWDRKSLEVGGLTLAVVAGMKKTNDQAERTKSRMLKKQKNTVLDLILERITVLIVKNLFLLIK